MREMLRSFAQGHPSTEGLLGETGGDPEVERLLQGYAFLAGRVRQQIDDEVPQVVHSLFEIAQPSFLCSTPSCSIVKFDANPETIRGREVVEAGTLLSSNPIDGTSCIFRTSMPVELLPLVLEAVSLDARESISPSLRLTFSTPVEESIFHQHGIRFYLDGEFALATMLQFWILRYCKNIRVRSLDRAGESMNLSPKCIAPVGFAQEHALLPGLNRVADGVRLLLEYFTLPQKFLFFDVLGLDSAMPVASKNFELVFSFDRPPPLPGNVGIDNIRLHCVPVINLFDASSRPIEIGNDGEYLLTADGVNQAHAEVHSVDNVKGAGTRSAQGIEYLPFMGISHALSPGEKSFYRLRRELSPTGDTLDCYISLLADPDSSGDSGDSKAGERISAKLTCTNGFLAGRLRSGDINQYLIPSALRRPPFANIIPATRPVLPPIGTSTLWKIWGDASLGYSALNETGALRDFLSKYNFAASSDHYVAKFNRARVDSIVSVSTRNCRRHLDGLALLGYATRIELTEAGFASRGDCFIFGSIIVEILASTITFNSFVDLTVVLKPSKAELKWDSKVGVVWP